MNVLQAFVMLFIVALVVVSASDAHDDDGKRSLRHGMPRVLSGGDNESGAGHGDRYGVTFYSITIIEHILISYHFI